MTPTTFFKALAGTSERIVGGHDIYNSCYDAWRKDWTVSQEMDRDLDYEVNFC